MHGIISYSGFTYAYVLPATLAIVEIVKRGDAFQSTLLIIYFLIVALALVIVNVGFQFLGQKFLLVWLIQLLTFWLFFFLSIQARALVYLRSFAALVFLCWALADKYLIFINYAALSENAGVFMNHLFVASKPIIILSLYVQELLVRRYKKELVFVIIMAILLMVSYFSKGSLVSFLIALACFKLAYLAGILAVSLFVLFLIFITKGNLDFWLELPGRLNIKNLLNSDTFIDRFSGTYGHFEIINFFGNWQVIFNHKYTTGFLQHNIFSVFELFGVILGLFLILRYLIWLKSNFYFFGVFVFIEILIFKSMGTPISAMFLALCLFGVKREKTAWDR